MSKLIYFYLNRPNSVTVNLFKCTSTGVLVKFFGTYGILYYLFFKKIYLEYFQDITKFYIIVCTKKKRLKKFLGLIFTLFASALLDVSLSYRFFLRLRGVGFKVFRKKTLLILEVGFSHLVQIKIPGNIYVKIKNRKNTRFLIQGFNRHFIKEFADYIKNLRYPNEYTLKGVHYRNEVLIKKIGKQLQQK